MIGVLPAAISTIIVSPTARPSPIITAENSPLAAEGTITRTAVCQGVAPAPSDALRRWSGTLESASSAIVKISGMIAKLIPTATTRALRCT